MYFLIKQNVCDIFIQRGEIMKAILCMHFSWKYIRNWLKKQQQLDINLIRISDFLFLFIF